jgi:hypothetical protein
MRTMFAFVMTNVQSVKCFGGDIVYVIDLTGRTVLQNAR